MPRSASDGQLPERLQQPRTEAQEAEYWLTKKNKQMCLDRIRGCYLESQLREFVKVANRIDVQDNDIYEAISEQLEKTNHE